MYKKHGTSGTHETTLKYHDPAEVRANAIVNRRNRRFTALEPFGASSVAWQPDPMAVRREH